jgi:manganese/iron transport system permease protein/iron/zinc/copper transport system permease protein
MNWLVEMLVRPLTEQAFQKALIGGGLVAIVCGVIGCFVILRRMAFLGDALSHAMLAGVTSGYLFMQIVFGIDAHAPGMLVGSIIAGLITVGLVGFVSKVSRIKEDTAIGIMYTGIFAVGGVLASIFSYRIHLDLYHFVTGMVLGVEDSDLWMMAVVAAVVLAIVILWYRYFQITTFDPVMAASLGIPVVAIDYLLTTCTSLVVVSAVSIVGVILVVGLLVTPAATAYLLSDRLHRMMGLSALFGLTGVVGGLYVSTWIGNVATGPSIVIASTLQFLVVLTVAPRYGLIADLLRRRSIVPQQIVEDVLGSFRYGEQGSIAIAQIQRHVHHRGDQVMRALRSMERDELLSIEGSHATLTDEGHREARRLLRAHRLWETYLEHVGTPAEELHSRAHELEHLHDEATVDYLDDKLGHPLRDPHGATIPEDFVHLVPGAEVKASLLREGHQGTVTAIDDAVANVGIRIGQVITAGPRSNDGLEWSFVLPDRSVVKLNHDAADAVMVKLGGETIQIAGSK